MTAADALALIGDGWLTLSVGMCFGMGLGCVLSSRRVEALRRDLLKTNRLLAAEHARAQTFARIVEDQLFDQEDTESGVDLLEKLANGELGK